MSVHEINTNEYSDTRQLVILATQKSSSSLFFLSFNGSTEDTSMWETELGQMIQ